jgi:hypothetical protein
MAYVNNFSKVKQIKVLLAILGAGLAAGVLITFSILHYYNPSGSYVAKNILLDPENAYTLRFVEPGLKATSDRRSVFEGMYFSYFDTQKKQFKSMLVPKKKYAELYDRIAHDTSILNPSNEVKSLFNQAHLSTLALKVRSITQDPLKGVEVNFSEIDFSPDGDYYRILLRQSGSELNWIHFYHHRIHQEAFNIFNPSL